jgi:lysophospholipase L1-like esterase
VIPIPGKLQIGSVLILADSIAAGTGDNADNLFYQGYIQRSLRNDVPFVTAARGSTTAFGLLAHGDGRYSLSIDNGVSDVYLSLAAIT